MGVRSEQIGTKSASYYPKTTHGIVTRSEAPYGLSAATVIVVSRCQSKPNEVVVEKVVESKVEVPKSLLTYSAEHIIG